MSSDSKIGILGGTFDPIHLGHRALGVAALKELGLEKLIIMPAKMQPFKLGKKVAEPVHRMNMAKMAFENIDNVEVSDYEMNNTEISYTYDTYLHLKKIYPDNTLYFVVGTDSFLQLAKWYMGTELLKNAGFAVSVRPGHKEHELEECIENYRSEYGTNVYKIYAKMPDISSTEIRKRLHFGKDTSNLLPNAVERYIKENGLYK